MSSSSVFPRRIYVSLHTGGTPEERILGPRPDSSEYFLGYVKKITKKKKTGCEIFQIFQWHDDKWGKMYTWNYILDCHGKVNIQQEDSFRQHIGHKLGEETSKNATLEHNFDGSETWTLEKVDQKIL